MRPSVHVRGAMLGLCAAALFGLSAPLAKLLLPLCGSLTLAAMLYLGGGAAVSLFRVFRRGSKEARLSRSDVPWLVGIVISGGMAGPVLMLLGLQRLSGVTGVLLLNLEGPFTILLAVAVFKEHLGRRALSAALLIVSAAVLLSVRPGELRGDPLGIVAIAAACLCWAIDNNFTQRLSLKDPIAVVRIKALGAGGLMLAVAFLGANGGRMHAEWPFRCCAGQAATASRSSSTRMPCVFWARPARRSASRRHRSLTRWPRCRFSANGCGLGTTSRGR